MLKEFQESDSVLLALPPKEKEKRSKLAEAMRNKLMLTLSKKRKDKEPSIELTVTQLPHFPLTANDNFWCILTKENPRKKNNKKKRQRMPLPWTPHDPCPILGYICIAASAARSCRVHQGPP